MHSKKRRSGFVILIEDNRQNAQATGEYLETQGYTVDYAYDGITGLHLASSNDYDAVVLDGALPGMDGLEVARRLRGEHKSNTPILMLTGRNTLNDKVAGLDMGADDYLCKPFDLRELNGRLRALIRRERRQVSREILTVGDLSFDTGTLAVTRAEQPLVLSPIGLRLLGILMRESPRVVSRSRLEREIWGEALPDSDTLRSHLYILRRTIDKPFDKPLMHTLPTAGYRLADLPMANKSNPATQAAAAIA
ncbi:MAG TPA: response regulator transcription factor [Dyella sp.]|uniref:response regulator transcription factor n=1 Tax=Dyella sp. TaxID=1869338 RepID=UPI002D793D6B|nr:response regulator transcription factor [Dyella sp.]HET6552484.1 response regulator transcription factor [Dyella sp.]